MVIGHGYILRNYFFFREGGSEIDLKRRDVAASTPKLFTYVNTQILLYYCLTQFFAAFSI